MSKRMSINMDKPFQFEMNGWTINFSGKEGDQEDVYRLAAVSSNWTVEIFPSKGLSVGKAYFKNEPLFWNAPTDLIHPDQFIPCETDIYINGKPAPGFSFLKTFSSGIELYGLLNWGMPKYDHKGRLLTLHGETSNIPVTCGEVEIGNDSLTITGSFIYRLFKREINNKWYNKGTPLFKVIKSVRILNEGKILINDTIENIFEKELIPDWGYHITFFATDGAKLLIPSKNVENRGGGILPSDMETWQRTPDEAIRSETGIIHKGLKKYKHSEGIVNKALVKYPYKNPLIVSFTPSPYTQAWYCTGGANSKEFTHKNGNPVFQKPWNGLGIELGSSALDHDGNIDEAIFYKRETKPGEKKNIFIEIEVSEQEKILSFEDEINKFNKKYRKN